MQSTKPQFEEFDAKQIREKLNDADIQASAPRLAIASFVLNTESHPTAEDIKREVEKSFPMVSLATVYNTLKLFVERGLVIEVEDSGSRGVKRCIRYDRNTKPHFHFIDEDTGEMHDLDPRALKVSPNQSLLGSQYVISEINVTVKGRRSKKGE
jgi:Fur family peroxide stress response transcriptional regulator